MGFIHILLILCNRSKSVNFSLLVYTFVKSLHNKIFLIDFCFFFFFRQKNPDKNTAKLHQPQDDRLHAGNYQQQSQDTSSHRVSWHRTTLAS